MNIRRSPSAPSKPHTPRPVNRLFTASTTNWYAEWKARKAAAASRLADDEPAPKHEDADTLTRWLTDRSGE